MQINLPATITAPPSFCHLNPFRQICVSGCRELHFLSAVWRRHVPPPSYLYKSLTNPCSQEEAVHVLFSHAARLAPGAKSLKTAAALQSSHKSITTESIRSNIEHVGLWGRRRNPLDTCCCVFVAGDAVMVPDLVQCRFSDSSTCPPALMVNSPPLPAQHQQDAHEQVITFHKN